MTRNHPNLRERDRAIRERVYDLVREAADNALPCPSNAELARGAGTENIRSVSLAISDLVAMGMIERDGVGRYRVIRITETGRATVRRPSGPPPKRSITSIIETVARVACLLPSEFICRSRQRIAVRPRILVYHFAREAGWSYPRIARACGRDSSSVIHACQTVPALLETDPLFARLYRRAAEALAGYEPPQPLTFRPRPRPFVRRPIEINCDDASEMTDLAGMRRGSAALLAAIRQARGGTRV